MASKKFKLASILSGPQTLDIKEEPIGPIVPFPDHMAKTIIQHLTGTGVIGMCGTAGSGKKTILKQVSRYPVREYIVQRQMGLDHLQELKRSLQPTLDGPCLWIVQPAELLNEPLVSAMSKHSGWQTKIVLISNNKIYGLPPSKVMYHNCTKHVQKVGAVIGATEDQIQGCCNDLRQLQLSVLLGHSGLIDKAPHVYFDTKAILSGHDKPLACYNIPWLEANLLSTQGDAGDLEQFADVYQNLAENDQLRNDELQAVCIRLALPKNRASPDKLIKPSFSDVSDKLPGRRRSYMQLGNYLAGET